MGRQASKLQLTMNTLNWMPVNFVAGLVASSAMAQTGTDLAVPPIDQPAREILQKAHAAYDALTSYRDQGQVTAALGGQILTNVFNIRLQRPNHYRVEWQQATAFATNGGAIWSAGDGDYLVLDLGSKVGEPKRQPDLQTALAAATGVSSQASATIPGTFFQQNWGDELKLRASGKAPLTQLPDEAVLGVACYVVQSVSGPVKLPANRGKTGKLTTTFWIGKQDNLIHQKREITEGAAFKLPELTDEQIAASLARQNRPTTPEAIAAFRKLLASSHERLEKQMGAGQIVTLETHDQIELNPALKPADFVR